MDSREDFPHLNPESHEGGGDDDLPGPDAYTGPVDPVVPPGSTSVESPPLPESQDSWTYSTDSSGNIQVTIGDVKAHAEYLHQTATGLLRSARERLETTSHAKPGAWSTALEYAQKIDDHREAHKKTIDTGIAAFDAYNIVMGDVISMFQKTKDETEVTAAELEKIMTTATKLFQSINWTGSETQSSGS
ncbi:hypothetical protein [Streptomyces sp. NPDC002588]